MNKRPVHRKHVLRSSHRRLSAPPTFDLGPLAVACSSLALGYSVTAKHARDEQIADRAIILADTYRSISALLAGLARSLGDEPTLRTKATCGERLRWEWIASSARIMDGAPEGRLLDECARTQRAAEVASATLQTDDVAALHPAMRQIHATLIRARNASVRLVAHPSHGRPAFASS